MFDFIREFIRILYSSWSPINWFPGLASTNPRITIIKVSKNGFFDSLLSGNFPYLLASYMGYIWLIIAIALLFAELNTPGLFFFLSFTVGAICSAVLAFMGYSIITQCVVGLVVSIMTFFFLRKYLKSKKMSDVMYGPAHTNIDALVGKNGVVIEQIKPSGKGLVKVGSELWRARCEGQEVLGKGTTVVVLRIEGNTLIVK